MRCAHGLRNGFAIAPAERVSNPALTTANKKRPHEGALNYNLVSALHGPRIGSGATFF